MAKGKPSKSKTQMAQTQMASPPLFPIGVLKNANKPMPQPSGHQALGKKGHKVPPMPLPPKGSNGGGYMG